MTSRPPHGMRAPFVAAGRSMAATALWTIAVDGAGRSRNGRRTSALVAYPCARVLSPGNALARVLLAGSGERRVVRWRGFGAGALTCRVRASRRTPGLHRFPDVCADREPTGRLARGPVHHVLRRSRVLRGWLRRGRLVRLRDPAARGESRGGLCGGLHDDRRMRDVLQLPGLRSGERYPGRFVLLPLAAELDGLRLRSPVRRPGGRLRGLLLRPRDVLARVVTRPARMRVPGMNQEGDTVTTAPKETAAS
jgi:hypothetical protein